MKITRARIQQVVEQVDTICNKCGGSCLRELAVGMSDFYGVDVAYSGGYCSGIGEGNHSKIRDSDQIKFSLCENCLSDLVESFVLSADSSHSSQEFAEIQYSLSKIYDAPKEDLAIFLTDPSPQVREYAKVRLAKLKESK